MNGRYFAGHKIICFYWDGKTDYRKPPESEEEMKKRIEEFGKWLGEEKKEEEEESEEEEEEEKKEEEGKVVSSAVSDAIQKMLDEKLAQLRKEKLKELEEAEKNAQ